MTRRTAKNVAQLAKMAGISPSAAYRWRDDGAPRLETGEFDVEAVLRWHRDRLAKVMDRSNGSPGALHVPDALREARAARERLKVELDELALRQRKGELVERDAVAAMLVDRAGTLKRSLRTMGRKLARRLAPITEPREIQRLIEREVDAVLRLYSREDA